MTYHEAQEAVRHAKFGDEDGIKARNFLREVEKCLDFAKEHGLESIQCRFCVGNGYHLCEDCDDTHECNRCDGTGFDMEEARDVLGKIQFDAVIAAEKILRQKRDSVDGKIGVTK